MSVPTEMIIFDELVKQDTPQSEENKILAERGFYWRERNGIKVLVCRYLEEQNFVNGFSTRLGGVSTFPENALNLAGFGEDSSENILENRRRFLSVFGSEYVLSTAWQVHGDQVKMVKTLEEAKDGNTKADAIVSNLKGILVGVKTADCVPILVADVKRGCFAAIHAGWRGTVCSITTKTLAKMGETYGSKIQDLICVLGPAAVSAYEVGSDVIEAFYKAFAEEADAFFRPSHREGHKFLNLHKANVFQLVKFGIPVENIKVAPFCTMQRSDLFFSYRVEKKIYGKVGRLLSVIGKAM